MIYLESIEPGNCISYEQHNYIVTTDFKNSGKRLCINLRNGNSRWISGDSPINIDPIYLMDKENNIVPLIKSKKES